MNLLNLPIQTVGFLEDILFFEIEGFPLIILCLMIAGFYFSIKLNFPAQRSFKRSFKSITGKNGTEKGLLNNLQSLFTSLSSIVGMGNITGVVAAITIGGSGSLFWMILMAFLGMNTSFAETLLACKYKKVSKENETVDCAPVVYIKESLNEFQKAS